MDAIKIFETLVEVIRKNPKKTIAIGGTGTILVGIAVKHWIEKNKNKIVKIAILGGKGCGKTELWYKLQGKERPSVEATNRDKIEKFTLGEKNDGRSVTVESTTDLGGGDEWVQAYNEIIDKDGTLIYFLVDLTRLNELKAETRARLAKILKINKNFKNNRIIILATFFDKCPGYKSDAVREIDKIIFSEKIEDENFQGLSRPVNLLNESDIKTIKDEIMNSIDKKI